MYCFVLPLVLRFTPQQFLVLHDASGMIRYTVSAPSLIRSPVAPGPRVSVLLDALNQGRHTLKRDESICHELRKL